MNRQLVQDRIAALTIEREKGQHLLQDLEARRVTIQATVLRIEGAMQVLGELLASVPTAGGSDGTT